MDVVYRTDTPTCIADAPIEVARSLFDPGRLDGWRHAKTRRGPPGGPLSAGQRIEAVAGPLGRSAVTADVLEVDPGVRRIRMSIRLPFGMINDETVTMAPHGPDRCRISFG